ncbi:hypothetical protein O9G_000917 [Rozella allomycis CSF55]|uniref:Uncharacterized protein n=1 Tax=Rozella allomycis (strain CSF55) TaxID=988480 RepID=A0A075AN98_ROZAC|nr:hypothetical protein O9G_000917 [Rozella allomycis CSF55]|eukprot:EPZ31272.1 hypothetical protein O9G_000917 [Rozella allomycis CSF55]
MFSVVIVDVYRYYPLEPSISTVIHFCVVGSLLFFVNACVKIIAGFASKQLTQKRSIIVYVSRFITSIILLSMIWVENDTYGLLGITTGFSLIQVLIDIAVEVFLRPQLTRRPVISHVAVDHINLNGVFALQSFNNDNNNLCLRNIDSDNDNKTI